jgi:glutaredoxin
MQVKIYSKPDCSFCEKAKNLCRLRQIPYDEIVVGVDITRNELLELFPEAKTVPQIVVDDDSIGGYNELKKRLGY